MSHRLPILSLLPSWVCLQRTATTEQDPAREAVPGEMVPRSTGQSGAFEALWFWGLGLRVFQMSLWQGARACTLQAGILDRLVSPPATPISLAAISEPTAADRLGAMWCIFSCTRRKMSACAQQGAASPRSMRSAAPQP